MGEIIKGGIEGGNTLLPKDVTPLGIVIEVRYARSEKE
jgi:hypothetical protein